MCLFVIKNMSQENKKFPEPAEFIFFFFEMSLKQTEIVHWWLFQRPIWLTNEYIYSSKIVYVTSSQIDTTICFTYNTMSLIMKQHYGSLIVFLIDIWHF